MQYFDDPTSVRLPRFKRAVLRRFGKLTARQFRQKFTRAWNDQMFSANRDGSDNHTGICELYSLEAS